MEIQDFTDYYRELRLPFKRSIIVAGVRTRVPSHYFRTVLRGLLLTGSYLSAYADPISITYENQNQTAHPGDTVIFDGSITNTTSLPIDFIIQAGPTPFEPLVLSINLGPNIPTHLDAHQSTGGIDLTELLLNGAFSGETFPQQVAVRFAASTLQGKTLTENDSFITILAPVPEPGHGMIAAGFLISLLGL
jgi:hypothetical protein